MFVVIEYSIVPFIDSKPEFLWTKAKVEVNTYILRVSYKTKLS